MLGYELDPRGTSRSFLLVVHVLVLLGSMWSAMASTYYALVTELRTTVSSPPVELLEGSAANCTSTIYGNGTSAKVRLEVSGSGGVDEEDYVDNNASDVDGSPDNGTHSNFTAQQYGPDLVNDTLTEANVTLTYEYIWISGNDDYVRKLNKTDPSGTEVLSWDTGTSYPFGCEYRVESGHEYVYIVDYGLDALIKFHASNGTQVTQWGISSFSGNAYGLAWNGSRWFIADWVDKRIYQADPADPTVAERNFTYTGIDYCEGLAWDGTYLWAADSGSDKVYQFDVFGNIQTSWDFTPTDPTGIAYDATSGHLWITGRFPAYLYEYYTNGTEIDHWDPTGSLTQGCAYASVDTWSYQLDLEVQWTTVNYEEPYELLCVYGGTMAAEDLRVDVWNGSRWNTLITELNAGWNNVSITSYLTSANFTIRFRAANETDDAIQDSWHVDTALLHIWAGNEVVGNATTATMDGSTKSNSYGKDRAVLRTTDANHTLHVFQINSSGYLQWWKSTDDGETWSKQIPAGFGPVASFSATTDPGNNIHLASSTGGAVYYRKQLYDASNWGTGVLIDGTDAHQPDVAVASYNSSWVYVIYDKHTTGGVRATQVYVKTSTNGGTSFGTAAEITYNAYTAAYTAGTFPSISIDNTLDTYGHIYATWVRGETYLYLRKGSLTSTGTITWDADPNVQTISPNMSNTSTTENTNMMHSACYSNGKYRVVYCEAGTTTYREWDESAWSSPIALATESGYPSLTYDANNYLYVFYHTNASNSNYDIRYRKSTDTTPTGFGAAQNVTEDNDGNKYVSAKLGGDNDLVEFVWTYGTSAPYQVRYNHISESAGGGPREDDFNYVLKFVEKDGANWNVRLRAYDQANIDRLANCSIYIYDGANSTHIVILDGSYNQQTGAWRDLNATDTEYLWIHVETLGSGTSYIYTYLEILVPNTTTYSQFIITFEIT